MIINTVLSPKLGAKKQEFRDLDVSQAERLSAGLGTAFHYPTFERQIPAAALDRQTSTAYAIHFAPQPLPSAGLAISTHALQQNV